MDVCHLDNSRTAIDFEFTSMVSDAIELRSEGESNRWFDDESLVSRFETTLMPLLAFPCAAVLIHRIVRLDLGQADRADKNPCSRFVDPNTIKNFVCLLAAIASFRTDPLNGQR